MKLWIMTALIALMTVSSYPQAARAAKTGNALLSFCEAEELSAQNLCSFYIEGVSDGYEARVYSLGGQQPWCYPEGATLGQAMRVVVKFLKKRPEDLHFDAGILVSAALIEAFPCN